MGFERYAIPEGSIMIAFSDQHVSVGYLEINPRQELAKHNRPALESLFQIQGRCAMRLFEDDGSIKEVVLEEGMSIDISPLTFHIHSNPYEEKSITFWKATGDIREIIEKIRVNKTVTP